MTTPNQILIPFAKDGQKASVPQTGTPEDTRASYTEGFPPNTMIPLSQGGIPPYGQDFNGVLNDITTQVQYLQAGAFYPYSAAFAEAIGGYPLGAIILKADGSGRWENTVENNMTDPDSSGAVGWVAAYTVPEGGTEGQALVKASDADGAFSWESIKPDSGVPVGTIEYFATSTPPAGYLKADGAAVGRQTYPKLFETIGTTFGEGDGSTTFNLPDLIDRFAQGSDVPGQKLEAGLPNAIGKLSGFFGFTPVYKSGALSTTGSAGVQFETIGVAGGASANKIINLDLSESNPIYGASSTVQPPALTLLPCIKAFDAATDPGLIDITELAQEMADKTDKMAAANAAMPSDRYVDLTPPAAINTETNYTAIDDGYVALRVESTAAGQGVCVSTDQVSSYSVATSTGHWPSTYIPVSKGSTFAMQYTGGTVRYCRFYYANGSVQQ